MNEFIISDVHLYPEGKSHPGREPLHRFLRKLGQGDPGRLWILGDLFDYWFEYSNLLPSGYTSTLCLLKDMAEKGWKIVFMPGNHDWWCGRNLEKATGMEIIRKSTHIQKIQGKTFLLSHGDGLGKGDTGYRIMKPVLRSPLSTMLFSLLHPSAATWLATRFSNTSRRILRKKIDTVPDYLASWAEEQGKKGVDVVVTGHTHCPSVTHLQGVIHASLGDWISHFTYLTIQGGEIQLNEFAN